MDATDTTLQSVTDSAQPSTDIDNPSNWNYFDPDEDQDTEKQPAQQRNEGEQAANAEGVQEAVEETPTEDADESQDDEQDDSKTESQDEILVPMPNGEKLSVSELKKGYLRQDRFTRGTQDLANRVRWVDERAHYVAAQMQAAVEFLKDTMPSRPDPALAQQNVAQYLAMERYYEDAQRKLAEATQRAQQPREILNELQAEQQRQVSEETLAQETERMVAALPILATEKGRAAFFAKAKEIGEIAGISEMELKSIADHRQVIVLDLAAEGLAARKAKQAAKAKVVNAPPFVPQKRKPNMSDSSVKNREAMGKLSRSGSFRDAMMVDFD